MFENKEDRWRNELIDYGLKLSKAGLNVNSSGNLSVRFNSEDGTGFLITPSGIPYEEIQPEDIVHIVVTNNGCFKAIGIKKPSSEWYLHEYLYRARPDIGAIVHTHSLYASMASCLDEPIPPFHYMVAAAGGTEIPCAPYATFGTPALAESCRDTMGKDLFGCLLSHHGSIAAGADLPKAYALAVEIESLARMWINLKQLGSCRLIDSEEMKRVQSQFKNYGQKSSND